MKCITDITLKSENEADFAEFMANNIHVSEIATPVVESVRESSQSRPKKKSPAPKPPEMLD